jgi:hypothetical protein
MCLLHFTFIFASYKCIFWATRQYDYNNSFWKYFLTSRVRTFQQTSLFIQLCSYVTLCSYVLSSCFCFEQRPITLFTKSRLCFVFGATSAQNAPWYFTPVVTILILSQHFHLNYESGHLMLDCLNSVCTFNFSGCYKSDRLFLLIKSLNKLQIMAILPSSLWSRNISWNFFLRLQQHVSLRRGSEAVLHACVL